jgi:tRNA1(Val) A37 N6-methylase TrmN6
LDFILNILLTIGPVAHATLVKVPFKVTLSLGPSFDIVTCNPYFFPKNGVEVKSQEEKVHRKKEGPNLFS